MSVRITLCAAILAFLANAQATADDLPYRTTTLDRASTGVLPLMADLDGNGETDLVFAKGSTLHIHFAQATNGIPASATQSLQIASDSALFEIGDIDDDTDTIEILAMTARGIDVYAIDTSKTPVRYATEPVTLSGITIDAPLPFASAPRARNLVFDADGDGREDLLLPTRTGYALHLRDDEGFAKPQAITLPLRGRVRAAPWNLAGAIETRLAYPLVYAGRFDGDDHRDLLFFDGDTLRVVSQVEPRVFESRPSRVIALDLRDVNRMPDQRQGAAPSWNPIATLDVDGDGYRDVVVNEMRAGAVKIFRGGSSLGDLARPDAMLRTGDWNLGAKFPDVDGDGRLDLVLPSTPEVGLSEGLRIVVTRSLAVTQTIFRNRGAELFDRRPTKTVPIEIPLDIRAEASQGSDAGFSLTPSMLIHYEGDYDGDGRGDLLVLERSDRLAIYAGRPDATWPTRPTHRIPIPDSRGAVRVTEVVRDLDGDGRSDIFLRYQGARAEENRSYLLSSRGAESGE